MIDEFQLIFPSIVIMTTCSIEFCKSSPFKRVERIVCQGNLLY